MGRAELLAEIKQTIAGQPIYGYRRVHALIRQRRQQQGDTALAQMMAMFSERAGSRRARSS
jgi:hypothetical protein